MPDDITEEKASELFGKILLENDLDEATMLKVCGMKILSDLHLDQRRPHDQFKDLWDFENRALALNGKLPHLKT